MFHENEFGLLSETFQKSRVPVYAISPDETVAELMDDAIKPIFENILSKETSVGSLFGTMHHKTLYRFKDNFTLSYTAFLLPPGDTNTLVIVGPYLHEPLIPE